MIVAICGEEKTYKSTLALSFPKPIKHYDLDVGGYARASWRIDTTDIISTSYPTPIQMDRLIGNKKEGATIRFPKKLTGIKETWQSIVTDFVADCQDSNVSTIIIDSATQLWSICHRSRLQELQEIQLARGEKDENRLREKLQPVEYGEPNDRMRSLVYTARSYGKNLILTHYPADIYAEAMTADGPKEYKTGETKPDGFKETIRLVDLVIWTDVDKRNNVTATITKCALPGLGSTATGLPLPNVSYQGLVQLADSMGAKI